MRSVSLYPSTYGFVNIKDNIHIEDNLYMVYKGDRQKEKSV